MKSLLTVVIVTCLVSGCNSEQGASVPLEDMKNAYYGYQTVESRVWINGVVGLGVEIEF